MDGSYTLSYGEACPRETTPGHVADQADDNTQTELSSFASTHTMIELLRSADAVVVSDLARARQLIDRVMSILRTTLDEQENASAAPTRTGRLAPWQERRLKDHIESNLGVSLR